MPAAYDVLRLTAADLGRMRALNAVFADAFEDPASYAGAPPGDAWLEGFLARDHVIVLVGVSEHGAVVGGLVAYELEKFEQARREVYIYDLAVAEAHRRRGVARALIETLQAICRERAVSTIFVQADYGDDPAIALYESLGEREAVLHFDIPV